MRILLSLLLLCLLQPESWGLSAQNKHDSLRKAVSERLWNIVTPLMSDDGGMLILRKSTRIPALEGNNLKKDTILFFDLQKRETEEIARVKQGGTRIAFVDNHNVLLTDSRQTELIDLKGQTSNYYKGVQQVRELRGKKQFVLHYGAGQKKRLELRSANGELLNEIENVDRFYTTGNGNIYVITENEGNIFEISILKGDRHEKVYATSRKIASMEIDSNEMGCMIFEQYPENNFQTAIYLDLKNNATYPLDEVLSIPFQRGFTEMIGEGSTYFLKLWVHKEKEDTSLVDVWYGNDNQLQEKFYQPVRVINFVWDPKKRFIQQIGNDSLTTNVNIGNGRYFLSFDPYLLQDYSRERALLQVQIFDRVQDRYSIMDTIAPTLYLSGNGKYALSSKNHVWYLYHIPSGSKKAIHSVKEPSVPWFKSEESGTPWFTDDGSAVLFEGDGALWEYDLQAGTLSQTAIFEGYQTSIVNGRWKGFSISNISLSKREVDLSAPLVIKLYDPQENITSYILWHRGDISPIIAPTKRHIQSLNYDTTYTHFSYIEEDHNMPPRLIYKETGKAEKIVYESNKEDKAVLSLKQEIISYTNKDKIPLKGILYYPLHYTPSGKYPMVVHIYEKQRHRANVYPYPSYYDDLGFNIRLLLENGYFVYLPDILVQGKDGPGMDALDCVNNALDALAGNPLINKHKIGLIGHSFGGYQTNFIAAHSNRFAAYVSGSAKSDIIWGYHAFNYHFRFPDHVRIIANQFKMGIPFSHNKALYCKNNPLYWAENVNAPVLLWTGMEDQNVTADHSMAFYNALRRNKKSVIALFYKNEGHVLLNKDAQFDLTSRIIDWFDYFLYGETNIEWIDKGMKKRDTP